MTTTIQVLSGVIFPDHIIAAGVKGSNRRLNDRTITQAGAPIITMVRGTLRSISIGSIPLPLRDWATMEGLHEYTGSGAYGMLAHDPKDHLCYYGEGVLQAFVGDALAGVAGQGYGVPQYKMFQRKKVIGTSLFFDRRVTRPQSPSNLERNAVAVQIGGSPGYASIDYDKGIVSFVADLSQSLASITVGGSTVLNFSNGSGIVAAHNVNDRVYLAGIAGSAAAALNGRSHQVSAKGATSLTIATATSGTATGGTGYKYPQASDLLTWSGPFYIPVHFRDDEIPWEIISSGPIASRLVTTGPEIVLQEIPEQ